MADENGIMFNTIQGKSVAEAIVALAIAIDHVIDLHGKHVLDTGQKMINISEYNVGNMEKISSSISDIITILTTNQTEISTLRQEVEDLKQENIKLQKQILTVSTLLPKGRSNG